MDSHCSSCKEVARELAKMLDFRRRGLPFKPESSNSLGIIAMFGTVAEISSKAKFTECPSCKDLEREITRWELLRERGFTQLDRCVVGVQIDWQPEITDEQDSLDEQDSNDEQEAHDDPPRQRLRVIAWDPTVETDPSRRLPRYYLVDLYPVEMGAPSDDRGRLFDSHYIDIGLIKNWLRCCDLTHREECALSLVDRLPQDTLPPRILLVDLERRFLSYGTLSDNYIALSYVWGKVDTLTATPDNLPDLLEYGGLDFARKDLVIPETVKDFMRLAVQLEIRYAWVDSLCIVQEGDDLQEQLDGMAAIYSSAYLTVIADGPDANFGLRGVGNGSEPRNTPCHVLRLPDMTCVFNDSINLGYEYSGWAKRVWTFQEGLFARRHLFFDVPGNIYWRCSSRYWFERYEPPSEKLNWIESHGIDIVSNRRLNTCFGLSDLNFQWPDMRRWCDLIQEYGDGERELTYDYDAHKAIAGLINVMDHVSPGGFFYGIPELFFDVYLLWDIDFVFDGIHKTPRRRECSELPSWSFLGWKDCKLDLFWWRNSMDYYAFHYDRFDDYSSECEVGCIVNWFKQDQACTKLIPIANQFHICRSQWVNELPQGWSRHEKDGKIYYTHESIASSRFRYPITLPQTSARRAESIKEQFSPYLHFKTRRGWLNIGTAVGCDEPRGIPRYSAPEYITASLVDGCGHWAGAIRLPFIQPNHLTTLPDIVSKDLRFELIAIATGKIRNQAFPKRAPGFSLLGPLEWHCEERPKQAEFYEFYFVLWIEWQDGIAYRRGLGRVEKQAWEKLPLEEIDIKLG